MWIKILFNIINFFMFYKVLNRLERRPKCVFSQDFYLYCLCVMSTCLKYTGIVVSISYLRFIGCFLHFICCIIDLTNIYDYISHIIFLSSDIIDTFHYGSHLFIFFMYYLFEYLLII